MFPSFLDCLVKHDFIKLIQALNFYPKKCNDAETLRPVDVNFGRLFGFRFLIQVPFRMCGYIIDI